jgi:hypothetical protein
MQTWNFSFNIVCPRLITRQSMNLDCRVLSVVSPERTFTGIGAHYSEGGGFFRTDSAMELPDIFFNAGPVMFCDEGLSQPFDDAYVFGPVVLKPSSPEPSSCAARGLMPSHESSTTFWRPKRIGAA